MAGVPTGILTLSGGGAGTQNVQRHDWADAVWDMAGVSTAMPHCSTAARDRHANRHPQAAHGSTGTRQVLKQSACATMWWL